jgi:C-terminal processing protease CtpA/Prc
MEFIIKSLRKADDVTIIGTATAGADGHLTDLPLPANIPFSFSCIGAYYADKTSYQRIGIQPDIKVEYTIKGLQEGRDELLEAALFFLQKKN